MNDSMIPVVKITKKSFSSDANIGFDGVLDLNAGAGLKRCRDNFLMITGDVYKCINRFHFNF